MEARVFIREDGEVVATGGAFLLPWWSFTKTTLAIALLRLSEQGRVSLDEVVKDKTYTPAQLLRHEAGLPDYGSLPSYHADVEARHAPWSVDDLLNAVEADRLRYEPGRGWTYSNIGYLVVAQLIEKASELPLADALADLVFHPAELASAKLAIVGTAEDAARLLRRLLAGHLVAPRSLARMLQPKPLPQYRSALHPDPAYGLGLMLRATDPLHHPIGHSGSGPGSRIAVYAQQGATCVIWAATTSGVDPEAEIFRRLRNGSI